MGKLKESELLTLNNRKLRRDVIIGHERNERPMKRRNIYIISFMGQEAMGFSYCKEDLIYV